MPARRALRPNRLPPAPPPRRHSVHSPAARKEESSLDRVRRISREHNKPFDPTTRGSWRGSSKDLVVNGYRKGDKHGLKPFAGEQEFVVIEREPDDRHPFILVNPTDYQGMRLFGLVFEYNTNVLVWARHLENALEPVADWLATYAPGLLVSAEEEQALVNEYRSEHPDADDDEAMSEAMSDLTYTEAGYIGVEWGISFDPDVEGTSSEIYKAALEASKEEYEEAYGEQTPNKRNLRKNSGAGSLDAFQRGYLETALWSSTDNADDSGGAPLDENYSIDDIAPKTLKEMLKDCDNFQEENAKLLERAGDDSQNGHDFWLTRNGHGAGFWDRGYPSAVGDGLSKACKAYGSFDLYVGDDGMIDGS